LPRVSAGCARDDFHTSQADVGSLSSRSTSSPDRKHNVMQELNTRMTNLFDGECGDLADAVSRGFNIGQIPRSTWGCEPGQL
jgi:hypothetical protein